VTHVDWSGWPVLEVHVRAPHPTCYARAVLDALRAGLHRGGPFAVVVVGEPGAPPRRMPVPGPIDTRWLRHCRGMLARQCRGIAYVTDQPAVGFPGCLTASCASVEAARDWARSRLESAPTSPPPVAARA
jgi:hypothetical protein